MTELDQYIIQRLKYWLDDFSYCSSDEEAGGYREGAINACKDILGEVLYIKYKNEKMLSIEEQKTSLEKLTILYAQKVLEGKNWKEILLKKDPKYDSKVLDSNHKNYLYGIQISIEALGGKIEGVI